VRVWHYTILGAASSIIRDGEIKCAEAYVKDEIRGVWLSTNPNWEETVRKAFRNTVTGVVSSPLSRDPLFRAGSTPTRIEIDLSTVKVTDWKTHRKKTTKKFAQQLEAIAKEWGANPDEWLISYKSIRTKSFVSPIEVWNGERWVVGIEFVVQTENPTESKTTNYLDPSQILAPWEPS
jgi:hypothetical protein